MKRSEASSQRREVGGWAQSAGAPYALILRRLLSFNILSPVRSQQQTEQSLPPGVGWLPERDIAA